MVVNAGVQDRPDTAAINTAKRPASGWNTATGRPTRPGARSARQRPFGPYGVKYWEIDNECWRLSPRTMRASSGSSPPPSRRSIPRSRSSPAAAGSLAATGATATGWSSPVRRQIDYLSVHHYENPERFADGPAQLEKFWRNLAGLIAKSANPNVKLYMSEWNAQSTDWRTGLYAGGFLNAAETQRRRAGHGRPGPLPAARLGPQLGQRFRELRPEPLVPRAELRGDEAAGASTTRRSASNWPASRVP